ncbi:MAG: C25 family peptidase propeptide domain-containing protein, partial [Bdellovibrionota bacterium]
MKLNFRLWSFCFLSFLNCIPAFAYVNVQHVGDKTVYDFVAEGVTVERRDVDGEEFRVAHLNGVDRYTGIHYEVGSPEVPVIRFNVVATDANDIKITTRSYFSENKFQIDGELKPVLASVEKVAGARYQILKNHHYKSIVAYPASDFQVSELGLSRGQKVFQVTLYPAQFIAATNEFTIARSYQVEVTKSVVAETLGADGIVFVVGAKFKNSRSLKEYMAKKTAMGLEVLQIDATGLNPEQIRQKIKSIYTVKKNLKYVLIVGDADDVPALQSSTIYGITDHYYASIDSDEY